MRYTLLTIFIFITLHLNAQTRLYVSSTATGANNGQSWADAFTDLQSALQAAQAGDSIWVAQGTYLPTDSTDRNVSFEPASGVLMFGGFAGNETSVEQRDWQANPVILSGDIGVPGDSTDNVYNVMYMAWPDSTTVLDGFVLRDGNADDQGGGPFRDRIKCGGGLYIQGIDGDAYPDIRNCIFEYNTAYNAGGGVMVNGEGDGSVAPQFYNCIFRYNHSMEVGGGMARYGGSWVEKRDLYQCTFEANEAGFRGGGFYYQDSERLDTLDIAECSFLKNYSGNSGGGVYLRLGRFIPVNCILGKLFIDGNITKTSGSGLLYPSESGLRKNTIHRQYEI